MSDQFLHQITGVRYNRQSGKKMQVVSQAKFEIFTPDTTTPVGQAVSFHKTGANTP